MNVYSTVESPLGEIRLFSDGRCLTGLYFSGQKYEFRPDPDWHAIPDLEIFERSRTELREYFAGRRRGFDVPVDLRGTPFQIRVWNALRAIPWGETLSYGDLAGRMGRKEAVRAVAAAVGRNPVSIIVPCHRVVGRDGSLTGYAGGLERKRALLDMEGALVK